MSSFGSAQVIGLSSRTICACLELQLEVVLKLIGTIVTGDGSARMTRDYSSFIIKIESPVRIADHTRTRAHWYAIETSTVVVQPKLTQARRSDT
jgi:hypothetical protein